MMRSYRNTFLIIIFFSCFSTLSIAAPVFYNSRNEAVKKTDALKLEFREQNEKYLMAKVAILRLKRGKSNIEIINAAFGNPVLIEEQGDGKQLILSFEVYANIPELIKLDNFYFIEIHILKMKLSCEINKETKIVKDFKVEENLYHEA